MAVEPAGSTFAAVLVNAPTGLVGTLEVGLDNLDGSTLTAPVTTGIAEIAPPSGVYVKSGLVAPSTQGDYLIVWNAPAEGVSGITEQLQVIASSATGTNDYVTLEDVKRALTLTGTTFVDEDIAAAITAASRAIDNYCGRRFWKDGGTVVREYLPRLSGGVDSPDLTWNDLDDLAELGSLTVDGTAWVVGTDFYLTPINAPLDGEPYTGVVSLSKQYGTSADGRIVVAGKFGWPQVPAPVTEACRILAVRLLRRVREASLGVVGFGMDGATVRVSSSDPDVKMLLAPYSRQGLFV